MCDIVLGEALRIWVKQFKQNLPENYLKSTKIIITACIISKIFRGSMPPDLPKAFLVSQSALALFCRKILRLKIVEVTAPPFQNFSLCHCLPACSSRCRL